LKHLITICLLLALSFVVCAQEVAKTKTESIAITASEKAQLDALLKEAQRKDAEVRILQAEAEKKQAELDRARAEWETLRQKYAVLQANARLEHSCKDCTLTEAGELIKPQTAQMPKEEKPIAKAEPSPPKKE